MHLHPIVTQYSSTRCCLGVAIKLFVEAVKLILISVRTACGMLTKACCLSPTIISLTKRPFLPYRLVFTSAEPAVVRAWQDKRPCLFQADNQSHDHACIGQQRRRPTHPLFRNGGVHLHYWDRTVRLCWPGWWKVSQKAARATNDASLRAEKGG